MLTLSTKIISGKRDVKAMFVCNVNNDVKNIDIARNVDFHNRKK